MKSPILLVSLLVTIFAQAQANLIETYTNNNSENIGTFQNVVFREGGFSGLHYIPGTNGTEFWTITDRGVNIDAANANPLTCRPTYDKIYGFPNYAPKIFKIKIQNGELVITNTITLKRPDGTPTTGIINPTNFGSTATEVASTNIVTDCNLFNNFVAPKDVWGLDSEGLDIDAQGNFWICEEGGPTIWKVNNKGVVEKRYTPYELLNNEDVAIDGCFKFRRNNRGFEGITVTPNGKIYVIIQSPLYYGNNAGVEGSVTLNNSRVHRILEIDPSTGNQKMFAYLNDGAIGTSADIRVRDQKVGDLKAINNNEFLVIEQAMRGSQNVKKIYKIDLTNATPVVSGLAYSNNTKTLEELNDEGTLLANNVVAVKKTLLFDAHAAGWPTSVEKAEGIAIIDASTIAICNDNDYGQICPNANGIPTASTEKCSIYKFSLATPLATFVQNKNEVILKSDVFINNNKQFVYPNPTLGIIKYSGFDNENAINYEIFNTVGVLVTKGEGNNNHEINIENLVKGIYILKINNLTFKINKE